VHLYIVVKLLEDVPTVLQSQIVIEVPKSLHYVGCIVAEILTEPRQNNINFQHDTLKVLLQTTYKLNSPFNLDD